MENFTPVTGFVGGLLIGVAAVMLMGLMGRIAGISGIIGGLFAPTEGEIGWRISFVIGLLAAPLIFGIANGSAPVVNAVHPLPLMIAGGFLVGVGTQIGGGCTSGHGVCGMARLSKRSVVATVIFMTCAILTVFVISKTLGI